MCECKYDFNGIELDIEFDYQPADPGKFSGPWEDSWPAEDEVIEITSITCNGKDFESDYVYLKEGDEYIWLDTAIEDFISTSREEWMDDSCE